VEVHLNSFVRVTLKPGEVVHVDSPERAFDWVPIAIIAAVIGPACIFILSNRMSYKNQQLNKARATKSTDAIIRDYLKLLDATDPQATKGATKGPGRPGRFLSRAPTDPCLRISRTRLLMSCSRSETAH
jgi:hypothetical protein